ncbi:predicted protein [Histoplasma capsulatum var. duboisii H88]|uniref:Predicted protein n=1 Tax=Ajellomyces capsulatus (strain H88) TaxID=544711 RepID=F0UKB5_AJEC8|nr:predicted protein [Histoplasma capsulatum var. duboisii H88]
MSLVVFRVGERKTGWRVVGGDDCCPAQAQGSGTPSVNTVKSPTTSSNLEQRQPLVRCKLPTKGRCGPMERAQQEEDLGLLGQKMEAAGEEEDLKRYFNILELSLVKVIYSPRPGRHWLLQTEAGAELSSMVLAAASMILALNSPSLPEHTQVGYHRALRIVPLLLDSG